MTTVDKVELAETEGCLLQVIAEEREIRREDMTAMESRLTERIDGVDSGLRTELIRLGRSLIGEFQVVNQRVDRLAGKVDSLEGKVDLVLEKLEG